MRSPAAPVLALVLAAALSATGCDAATGQSWGSGRGGGPGEGSGWGGGAGFSSVRFTLGSHGDIHVSGASRTAVSRAGTYAVTGGRVYPFERAEDKLLVVLRHWPEQQPSNWVVPQLDRSEGRAARGAARRMPPPEEPAVETAYLVDTAGWTLAELDGHPLRWLRHDTLRVDTTRNTDAERVSLRLSGPNGGRSGKPEPEEAEESGESGEGGGVCGGVDRSVPRRVDVPEFRPGATVAAVLARLREQCLDVQYASLPGGAPRGTVRRIEIPLAARNAPTATLPPPDGTAAPDPRVLTDPSRPTMVVVAR